MDACVEVACIRACMGACTGASVLMWGGAWVGGWGNEGVHVGLRLGVLVHVPAHTRVCPGRRPCVYALQICVFECMLPVQMHVCMCTWACALVGSRVRAQACACAHACEGQGMLVCRASAVHVKDYYNANNIKSILCQHTYTTILVMQAHLVLEQLRLCCHPLERVEGCGMILLPSSRHKQRGLGLGLCS